MSDYWEKIYKITKKSTFYVDKNGKRWYNQKSELEFNYSKAKAL